MARSGDDATLGAATGVLAGLLAALVWAGWIVATREATARDYGAALTPVDIGLLRFSAPALLLAPVWLAPVLSARGALGARLGASLKPPGVTWALLFGLFLWGAPFTLFAALGAARADTTAFSAMVPGAMPLYAAALGFLLFGERPAPGRRVGLVLILAAAGLTLIARSAAAGFWAAAPYLALAALSWAGYAVAFRRAGLSATRAAGLVGALSTLALLPLALLGGSGLPDLSLAALGWQILAQGVLSGTVSVIAYGIALDRLGPPAAAFAALVPPLATLMGWGWLGEVPGWLGGGATVLAGIGVALASGVLASGALRRP